jgi:hypothetical protein
MLIIDDQAIPSATVPSGPWKKLKSLVRAQNRLWVMYQRFCVDGRIHALESVDLSGELGDLPALRCRVIRKGRFSEYFSPDDVRRVREAGLDFLLRFAFGIIRGEILESARYGVWSFHHDDEQRYRGGPPAFWEIYCQDPHTGVVLQRLTERLDGGIILKKGLFETAGHSYAENRDRGLFGGAGWPAEVCRDIYAARADYLFSKPSQSAAPIYRAPAEAQMLRYLGILGWNKLTRRWTGTK